MTQYITSESVTEGHPDKVCDLIADSLLDAYLQQDPHAHVAIECMIAKELVVVAGEVTANAQVDIERVVRETLIHCGYTQVSQGMDGYRCTVLIRLQKQAVEIQQAVTKTQKQRSDDLGAGDQGLMYGYATNETTALLPPSLYYAQRLAQQLAAVRKKHVLAYLRPDGKTQVTMTLDRHGKCKKIKSLIISAQHEPGIPLEQLKEDLYREVIQPIIPTDWLSAETACYINPSGSFTIGGPAADTGLTGRKIIVDTYGGVIPHGGGAFSGKDPTKVDRSGAYMARYVAKQVVASGLAEKCQIALSYAIGLTKPMAVSVETFHTAKISETIIESAINALFDFSPKGIITQLNLCRPIYQQTACYGHFKAEKNNLPWERIDRVDELRALLD